MKRWRIAGAGAGAGALVLALVWLVAEPALTAVPEAARIERAIAETNRADGRDEALRLELTLTIGAEARVVATGELISHPQGLARLELQGAGNLVERHLLQGSELMVSRGGQMLEEHRSFLAPFFILQADTAETLRMALASFDVRPDIVGLGMCGENDCFVIGDPRREVPRPALREVRGLASEALEPGLDAGAEDAPAFSGEAPIDAGVDETDPQAAEVNWPRLWVEMESFEIRGIDSATGVRFRFGPIAVFDELRVPAWVTIEEPGKGVSRFEVLRASQVTAPASAFTPAWLTSPVVTDDPNAPGAPAEQAPGLD